jgi:8-oxo-dGTP pyrophosphatase MutT (NUDIX family)
MTIAERIRAARVFDPSRFLPFVVEGVRIGHVRRDLAALLRAFPRTFTLTEVACGFGRELADVESRSNAIAEVAAELAGQGLLSPWRNETYDITAGDEGACLFRLERAAVRFFGFWARAVHVNGLADLGGAKRMWIARRSPEKAIDPGMLDNMVGGGLASGLSIEQTLVKEAWEEAGVPGELAAAARPAGSMRILREVPEGLHAEIIYAHDLALPKAFVPVNQDGEVAELALWSFDAVHAALASDAEFTVDAGLVAIDCLLRHGVLDPRWAAELHVVPDQ